MTRLRTTVTASAVIALVGAVFVVGWLWSLARPAASEGREVTFTVEEGEGVRDIAQSLEAAELIRSPWYFIWTVKRSGWGGRLQAGVYTLSPAQTPADIARTLAGGGDTGRERAITIVEGWRIDDIAAYLEEEGVVSASDFKAATAGPLVARSACLKPDNCGEGYAFLSGLPAGGGLEGFLFPDTYRIFRDATAEDIVIKMLDNFDRKLTPEMRADIEASGLSLYETVILASIIEKEVRTAEDMAVVSGIFHNRLDIGMGLQSDATLTYYFGNKKAAHSGEELQVDTPYNTYKYRGLPPTPISNPGLNALRAAIYPADTDYFYFLSNTDTGETYFARTLEEHNENKREHVR